MSAHNDGGPVDVLAITQEMRARLVNKRMSPTLIAWADRIDTAVAALIAERDALREALKPFAAADLRKQGWPKAFRDQVIKARAALATGESA